MNFLKMRDHLNEPIYKNSFYIMIATLMSSIFGFLFWILAAKLYSAEAVGLATAIISAMNLICLFSYFGFDQSIIRFIPQMDKNKVFSTSITITSLLTVILGIFFVFSVSFWSQQLIIIQAIPIIFIGIVLVDTLTTIIGTTFVGLRNAKYYLVSNILAGSRILFLFYFVILGAFGIFYSVGLGMFLALAISLLFIYKFKIRYKGLNREFLDHSIHFSVSNYAAGLLGLAPTYILPIIVLNLLGAAEAAYYYIAFTIASILFFIPSAFSTSLFVEGSHGEPVKKNVYKSLISIFCLLVLGILFLLVFGKPLLGFIGSNYLKGYNLLLTMSLSSFFVGIYQIYFSIKKIEKKIKSLILLNILLFIMLMGLSYLFIINFGIIGVGYAFIIGYGINCFLISILSFKKLI